MMTDVCDPCTAELEDWPEERLERELCQGAADIAAAEARWLRVLAEFDRRIGWATSGCRSCAQWLSWQCGMAPITAREHVRVARRLVDFPDTWSTFANGELSFSKVRAMTRVLTSANEALLLMYARHATAAQLERMLRAYKGVRDNMDDDGASDPDEARRARRYASWFWDDDGMLVLRARIPPDQAAVVVKGLLEFDAVAPEQATGADRPVPAETPSPPPPTLRCGSGAHWADALVAMAGAALTNGPPEGPAGPLPEVLVHLDLELLRQGDVDATGLAACHFEGGPDLTAQVARRLACDCGLRAIVEEGATGRTLDVGVRSRVPNVALRKALWLRDGGCVFPGCGSCRYVDAHHIRHWIDGGSPTWQT